ncbi:hypothetical protein [Raoultella terrigena]|uniref:hypothetical protein n=1 Tax=Raoultella terrigena TaxID=577 RepID=UPI000977CD10|nr:hypothetical protein [Raoultella terrigena]OMP92723.1 hypothetical protein BZP36_17705 [Raoultella terrigena]
MTTDTTELAQMKGQKVEGSYYLAECTDCGKMYPSNKLNGGEPLFSGDYGECYCPHCNADDADIADLGSGEQPAVMAWNYQQARIDALVEALEKAQRAQPCEHSMFWDASGVKRCSKCDMPEHANVHYADAAEMEIAALRLRIAELEKSELQLIDERDIAEEALSDMYQAATGERPEWSNMFGFADAVDAVEHRLGELESRTVTVKLPRHGFITISGKRTAVYLKADVDAALATAGIREDE